MFCTRFQILLADDVVESQESHSVARIILISMAWNRKGYFSPIQQLVVAEHTICHTVVDGHSGIVEVQIF